MKVRRKFPFEAAHKLPNHPGKCRELHGHSYVLEVTLDRPVDPVSGMAIDFADLKAVVTREVVDQLDHRYVNDLIDNPTAEVMARWIWQRLARVLPGMVEIELHETATCSVVYAGE
jgi:6-pyruvoyltetrahydropterin/6-carboxytetrahydropterin synthase